MSSRFSPNRPGCFSGSPRLVARPSAFPIRFVAAILTLVFGANVSAQTEEFRVNSYSTGIQLWPDVTTFADGSFVVVWQSRTSPGDDSAGSSILARRFDSSASPLGEDFQVNTATPFDQTQAQVETLADNSFVVVWNTASSPVLNPGEAELLGETGDINAQVFDSSGNPIASEFQINAPGELVTNYGHEVTANGQGGFAVVWDNFDDEVFFRAYDASGSPLTSPILLASDGCFTSSSIATLDDSVYLPAWYCHGGATVSFQRYDSTGTPLAATQTAPTQVRVAQVAAVDDGFVLATLSDGDEQWSGQRFDSAGLPMGSLFDLSREVWALDAGPEGIATVWYDGLPAGSDTDRLGIKRGRFSSSGATLSAAGQVNVFTTHDQARPDIAALPDGRFVVVWDSYFSDDGDNNWSIRAGIVEDDLFTDTFESGNLTAWSQVIP